MSVGAMIVSMLYLYRDVGTRDLHTSICPAQSVILQARKPQYTANSKYMQGGVDCDNTTILQCILSTDSNPVGEISLPLANTTLNWLVKGIV